MDATKFQLGDVILFQGTAFISRGIEWFSKSKWSHAALYVGGGNGYIIEATGAGVERNKLETSLHGCSSYCVRRMPNLTMEQAELIKDKAYSLIYKKDKYDFIQLLTLGIYFTLRKIGITWAWLVDNMPNKMICSELVAVCYLTLPIKFKSKIKLVTPETLYSTGILTTIEELEIK